MGLPDGAGAQPAQAARRCILAAIKGFAAGSDFRPPSSTRIGAMNTPTLRGVSPMLRTVPALVTSLALMLAPISFALAKPAAPAAPSAHRLFRVTLDPAASAQLVSGRLLLFAVPHLVAESQAHGKPVTRVDTNPFHPAQTAVAAMKLVHLAPGGTVVIDADALAFPTPFSQLAPGAYDIQAVLDINHDYNYSGRGPGDLVSDVVQVHFGDAAGATPSLRLSRALGADTAMQSWALPARVPEKMRQQMQPQMDAARAHSHAIDFVSPALTAFWGRPIHMKGWVLLPPGYDAKGKITYPVAYHTHGFGGGDRSEAMTGLSTYAQMAEKAIPPMIWVLLDESSPTGTHEFADSVNN
ncbi:MAG TPA: hypothetical protein VFW82_05460, partial [Dyella sp.]|nr:hypothetical protein [Dyella sp.]